MGISWLANATRKIFPKLWLFVVLLMQQGKLWIKSGVKVAKDSFLLLSKVLKWSLMSVISRPTIWGKKFNIVSASTCPSSSKVIVRLVSWLFSYTSKITAKSAEVQGNNYWNLTKIRFTHQQFHGSKNCIQRNTATGKYYRKIPIIHPPPPQKKNKWINKENK